jgi:hypothetical protein
MVASGDNGTVGNEEGGAVVDWVSATRRYLPVIFPGKLDIRRDRSIQEDCLRRVHARRGCVSFIDNEEIRMLKCPMCQLTRHNEIEGSCIWI